jgi:sortase A
MRVKQKIPYFLMGVFLAAGLLLLFYPTLSSWYNAQYQIEAVVTYDEAIQSISSQAMAADMEKAKEYNEKLTGQGITDPFIPGGGLVLPENYTDVLDVHDGVMGSVQIPCIDVNLPIYHGTSESVLQKGVGHMEMTAFPIGGEGNHTVLTGHTALPNAVLFTDLDRLVEGNMFYIKVYKSVLAYQVDQVMVIEPDDTQPLIPVPGKDYVTLVTCTPYTINSHRLLVRGMRIPYTPQEAQAHLQEESGQGKAPVRYDFVIAMTVLLVVIAALSRPLIRWLQRRYREKSAEASKAGDE